MAKKKRTYQMSIRAYFPNGRKCDRHISMRLDELPE